MWEGGQLFPPIDQYKREKKHPKKMFSITLFLFCRRIG